jgi:hypothetical protein
MTALKSVCKGISTSCKALAYRMVAGRSLTEYSSIIILYGSVGYGSVGYGSVVYGSVVYGWILYGWILNWLGLWCSVCHRVRVCRLHWFVLRIFDRRSVPHCLHFYLLRHCMLLHKDCTYQVRI